LPAAQPVVLSAHEHLRYRWLPAEAAADACFSPSNAAAIRLLSARL
jgi:dATP pyrophosphohydrolase